MVTTVWGTDNWFINVWKKNLYIEIKKQHKARELGMITLRNHAQRSYMSVLDMIIESGYMKS